MVVSTVLIGIGRWLLAGENRERAANAVKQRLCRHEWEPINEPGSGIFIVTGDRDWCVKCGARR